MKLQKIIEDINNSIKVDDLMKKAFSKIQFDNPVIIKIGGDGLDSCPWRWMYDFEENDIETMSSGMEILITADQIKNLINEVFADGYEAGVEEERCNSGIM